MLTFMDNIFFDGLRLHVEKSWDKRMDSYQERIKINTIQPSQSPTKLNPKEQTPQPTTI